MPATAWLSRSPFETDLAASLLDSPQANGLVAWWPTTTGRAFRDMMALRLNGTLSGTLTWQQDAQVGPNFLYGAGEWTVSDPNDKLSLALPYTWSCWINNPATSNLVIWEKNGNNGVSIQSNTAGNIYMNTSGSVNTFSGFDGNWHLLQLSVDTVGLVTPRLDARALTSPALVSTPTWGTAQPMYVGSRGGSFQWAGSLADLRIYNRVLSDADAWAQFDPQTRWQLYRPLRRRVRYGVAAAAFDPATVPWQTDTPISPGLALVGF